MKEVTKFEKVLIVAMLLAMTFLLTASSQTEASGLPFGTQIGEYNKIIAYSNYDINYASGEYNYINSYNTGMKWHCVEYINRYYYITYGMEIRIPGTNAEDYYDTASERELGAYPNGGTVGPQPGDILCSNGGDYGHVAIIREVTDDAIHVIHQNWTNTEADNDKIIDMSVSDGHFTVSGFSPSYPVQGWLRKLPTPRGWLAAAVIGNIIYSIGGGTCEGIECGMFGGNETSVVEAYDPSTNVWTVKPPLDIARFGLTTSEVNGKIYAIGGTSGCCSQPVSSVEEYDLNSDTWSLKTTMPTPRWKLTSSVVDGRIYTIGGGATGNQCSPTGTVEEYDPVNDMWATKNPMPTPRWGADSVVINGQIYVVGGSSACPHIIVEPSSALEVYDPFTDTWTVKTPMPTARWDLAAAVVNEKIYAIGGWDPQSESPLQTVEEYDPDTNTWATKSPMPTARTGVVAPAINGRIYAFGGFDGSNVTGTVEVYDPITDTWLPIADYTVDKTEGTCPLTVQFTDQSTGDITEWYWDFGDGKTSTEQNPIHIYNTPGTYTVSLTVTGPGGTDTETKPDYITVTAEWTFFVYLGADNSLSSYADLDLEEMQQVGSDSNVNVVTLVDQHGHHDTHFYKVGYGSLTETSLSEIDPTWIDEVDMSDPSTLVTSANYVINQYPANRYCIVLWNHGDGWKKEPKKLVYRAIIEDKGNIMRMDDAGHALSDIKAHLGSKIDLVGFDACLMGMVEVAYEIRDHAKVMVGSEDLIGGEGWPYDTILEDLVNSPAMDSETFARNTVDRYAELCDGTPYWTLSALRLNMAYDLAMLIDDFADSLTSNWNEIRLARSNSQEFAFWYLPYFHEHVDLYDFCSELNTAEAQAVMGKIDDMVINERHSSDLPDSYGLAIYFPANGEDYDSEYHASPDHQIMFPVDTSWDEFLSRYYGEPIPDIKANGSDGPLFVTPSESVDISISLDPGNMTGEWADWWGILLSSYGNFPLFGFQSPLFELPDTSLFSSPWPMGWYIFLFGLDDVPDGAFELDWYDYVIVVSQPAGAQLKNIPNFDDIVKEKLRELIGE